MASCYIDSPNNSTLFTTCCDVAINDDQATCPKCRGEVDSPGDSLRLRHARASEKVQRRGYGNHWKNDRAPR